jgi:dihydrofolate reductase
MYAILAQSKNGVIGRDGKLPWNIPEDMLFFQRTTKHNIVIMGRKTYESFEILRSNSEVKSNFMEQERSKMGSAAPLKNRINIVLSNSPRPAAAAADIYWANTVEQVFAITRNFPDMKKFIIGGATIYKLFENYIDYYYITYIDKEYSGDCYAPAVPPRGGEAAAEWNKNNIIDFYSKK